MYTHKQKKRKMTDKCGGTDSRGKRCPYIWANVYPILFLFDKTRGTTTAQILIAVLLKKQELAIIKYYNCADFKFHVKGVGMIRVNFGPISETVFIDIILNTIIKR